MLAIVDQENHRPPWREALRDVIVQHSRSPNFDPDFSLPDERRRRGLLDIRGRAQTGR
jgi:hypothetical protein